MFSINLKSKFFKLNVAFQEWFSVGVSALASKLARANEMGLSDLSENSIQTLTSHAREFQAMADTCLIILHLEVTDFFLSNL